MTTAAAHSDYNAVVLELRKRVDRLVGRQLQLHVQPAARTTRSASSDRQLPRVRRRAGHRRQLQLHSRIAELQPGRRLRAEPERHAAQAGDCADRPGCRSGQDGASGSRLLTRWSVAGRVSAVVLVQSGFPIAVTQTPNTTNLNGARSATESRRRVRIHCAVGDITDRLAASTSDNLYLQSCRRSRSRRRSRCGNAPMILPGVRSPLRTSTDIALNKDFRTGGHRSATIRLEILNPF